MVLTTIILIFR